MTWVLVSGIVLIALGMFAAGVASGPWVKGACRSLNGKRRSLPLFRPHAGHHVPAHAAALTTGAAASVLLANRNAEALGFPVRVSLTPQEHADAMRELAGPYLLPVPAQAHVPVHARTLPRADAPGHPPWHTAGQGILTDAAVREIEREAARVEYVRSLLTEHGATAETMRDAIDGLRNWDPKVYGEAPVADVLEGERLAAVMQP